MPPPEPPAGTSLVVPAVVFAAGVAALQLQPQLPDPLAPALFAALLVALSAGIRRGGGVRRSSGFSWRRLLLLAGIGFAAFAWAAWRAELRLADALPEAWEGRDIRVVGVVAELPRHFERGGRFLFHVDAVQTAGAVVPRRIMLSWYRAGDAEETVDDSLPLPGERRALTVRLKRPHGHANPGGFDYEAWLLERDIRATGYVRQSPPPQTLAAGTPGLLLAVERLRDHLRRGVAGALADSPHAGVLIALAIGDQGSIDADQWRTFAATGTTHLMSISGLHVTMFAGLIGAVVAALWRRSERLTLRLPVRRAAVAAGFVAALAYSLLAGFGVPAQRTLYMLGVAAVALWSARATPPRQTLALALLLVLLLDPWAVLAAGFWLSFGAVAVLMMAGNARRFAVGGAPSGWRADWLGHLRAWGWTQWAVTIGSAPLLVWLFQQVSLVSPLANAVAIPLVSLVVTPLAVFGSLGVAFVPGVWGLELAHAVLAPLMRLLESLAAFPMAVWRQPEPPLWAVGVGMLGVVVLLLPRGMPGRWAGLALLAPALFPPVARPAVATARVDLLDVGHGLASVVRTASHVLVFDTGPRYGPATDAGERILVPVLRAAGIDAVDMLIVSHRDSDHSGGTEALLEALPVRSSRSSLAADDELRLRLPGHLPCVAGQEWEWDGVRFALLHPAAADYARAENPAHRPKTNLLSCVLRIDAGAQSLLLTGDIEAPNEAALLAAAAPLRADVLVAPHHGSRSSSTAAFLQAVAPRAIVATVGYRNRFGHPHADVVGRYAATGAGLWRTDRDGAVRVDLGAGAAPRLRAWRDERRRYWGDR